LGGKNNLSQIKICLFWSFRALVAKILEIDLVNFSVLVFLWQKKKDIKIRGL
jgi:hypothetical protein